MMHDVQYRLDDTQQAMCTHSKTPNTRLHHVLRTEYDIRHQFRQQGRVADAEARDTDTCMFKKASTK